MDVVEADQTRKDYVIEALKDDPFATIPLGRNGHYLHGRWPDPTTRFEEKDGTYNLVWTDENDVRME